MTKDPLPKSTEAMLRKQIKELECLYHISQIAAQFNTPLEEMLKSIVEFLPRALQYPKIAAASIMLDGVSYATAGYCQNPQKQTANIVINGVPRGVAEIAYVNDKSEFGKDASLKQEHNLIDAVASQVALIVERKKVQEELKASEVRFRKLSEAAFEGIGIHRNKKIFDVNPKFIEMFGYTLDELDNMSCLNLIHPDFREILDRYIDAGKTGPHETIGLRKNGSTFPIEIQGRAISDQGHRYGIGVIRDLSVKKQLEDEREMYKERVLKAQKHAYIGSMGAIVAHQVNQPLTKINILLDRAIDQIEEKSCCTSILQSIKDSLAEAQKAALIIRKFRENSKDSALEGTGKVNVGIVANNIVSVLSERTRQAKIIISLKGLEDLPELEINETALEQIFLIIIQNAIEAADGQKSHKLGITGKFAEGNIELQFADDCSGIAPENLDRIFKPFFSTKAEDQGLGLGLDIVQQLLIICGGQIRVESQIGKGTIFYITLPISNLLDQ